VRREIAGLSPEQRQALVDSVVQDLASRGLMTAVIARRAAQGDVLHGTLGVEVIRAYATRMYGPDWDRPDAGDLFAGQT